MDNLTFGWTMIVLGMGATLITLLLLTLVIRLLIRLFPHEDEVSESNKACNPVLKQGGN